VDVNTKIPSGTALVAVSINEYTNDGHVAKLTDHEGLATVTKDPTRMSYVVLLIALEDIVAEEQPSITFTVNDTEPVAA
jgi:hypothetical protein